MTLRKDISKRTPPPSASAWRNRATIAEPAEGWSERRSIESMTVCVLLHCGTPASRMLSYTWPEMQGGWSVMLM